MNKESIQNICEKESHRLYGNTLPVQLASRLEWELKKCEENNFENRYISGIEVIKKMRLKRYQIGFQGTIGNSLLAYLAGITECNPLQLHDRCIEGHYVRFANETTSEYSVPNMHCPICGKKLTRDGYGLIPYFSTGYCGDKVPDIRLRIGKHYIDEMKDRRQIKMVPSVEYDMLTRLAKETGLDPENIPMDDTQVLKIFQENARFYQGMESNDQLVSGCVQDILNTITPQSFLETVKVRNSAYGTGTWHGNGKYLLENQKVELRGIIASREDVYDLLRNYALSEKDAFTMSEYIRKGRDLTKDQCEQLYETDMPLFFGDSLKKIKKLCGKAEGILDMLLKWRLAYYKCYNAEVFQKCIHDIKHDK